MKNFLALSGVVFCILICCKSEVTGANWPAWRGPNGDGKSSEANLPTQWSPTNNILWKTPLPGEGNSTPIVWNNHVFVTCPIDGGKIRSLIGLDRNNGKQLWRRDFLYPQTETTHLDNPFCSGSPTTDGKFVYASFGSAGVVACDFDGHVIWHRKLPKLKHVFGLATTPVLYGDLLIIHRGPGEPTHIVALDTKTGQTVWDRPERAKNHKLFGSWSTPIIVRVGDHDELVLALPDEFKGYDPLTGKELWRCAGLGASLYAAPSWGDNTVFGLGGLPGATLAVRLGGRGDVTQTHLLWETRRNQRRIGSGVVHNGYLFVANSAGIAECIDATTGQVVWKKRLGGKLWGSILLASGRLFYSNTDGTVFVLKAGPEYRMLAKNEMKEHLKAALAPSNDQLFIRTYQNLYCVGKRRKSP
jgi:outer membrane protein assembly factor BamB